MATVLITNGGPHSAEDWAMATAEAIFQIEPSVNGARLLQARRLQTEIAELLINHHQSIIDMERRNLQRNTQEDFSYGNALAAVQAIAHIAKDTPWEDHINGDPWMQTAHHTILNHMQSMQHVERSWHRDHQ